MLCVKGQTMFNQSSIAKRLALGFGIVLLLLIVVAVTGYWGMESVTKEAVAMLRGESKLSQLADQAKVETLELRRFEKDMLLNLDNKPVMQSYREKWRAQLEDLKANITELSNRITTDEDKQSIAAIQNDLSGYEHGVMGVVAKIEDGIIKTPQQGNAAVTDFKDEVHRMEASATDLADRHRKIMSEKEGVIIDFAR